MKEIRLNKGMVALVDDADFEVLSQWNWTAWEAKSKNSSRFYAISNGPYRGGPGRGMAYMHKYIIGSKSEIDHIDGNGLNNQRSNLREVTRSQNCWNMGKTRGASVFKGVSPSFRVKKPWKAQIAFAGKQMYIGHFRDEVDAATAYNFKAYELFGEFARFNEPILVEPHD